MAVIIIFILWYNQGHTEDIIIETQATTTTGDVVEEPTLEETIIYTREATLESLANKVDAVIGDYNISYAIVKECTEQVFDDYKQCIKSIVGVSNAESTLFTKWMSPTNNWLGLMYKWKKRKFSSVEESIQFWVSLYKKNNWGKRVTGQDWVGTYCMSECKYRAKNYSSAVKKLDLD